MATPQQRRDHHGSSSGNNGSSRPASRPKKPQHASLGEPYDPTQFMVRARNDNDHAEYLPKLQVTPELKAEVEAIGNSTSFEFGSTANFMRWCLVIGIEEARRIRPDWQTNISIIRAMDLESARHQTRLNFLNHIETKAKEAFELQGRGLHNEAAKHVYLVLQQIRKMHPDDPWRPVFEAEWKKRFGKLLTRGKLVSFVPEPDAEAPQPAEDWMMPADRDAEHSPN